MWRLFGTFTYKVSKNTTVHQQSILYILSGDVCQFRSQFPLHVDNVGVKYAKDNGLHLQKRFLNIILLFFPCFSAIVFKKLKRQQN